MADAKVNLKGLLFDPIVKNNPIALQIFGYLFCISGNDPITNSNRYGDCGKFGNRFLQFVHFIDS